VWRSEREKVVIKALEKLGGDIRGLKGTGGCKITCANDYEILGLLK
jgi:hypothetical protein